MLLPNKRLPTIFVFVISAFAFFALAISIIFWGKTFSFKSVQAASENLSVYSDSISPGWNNWSWGSDIKFDNSSFVYEGSRSISFKPYPWGGLYFRTENPISLSEYKSLQFALKASYDGQKFRVIFYDSSGQEQKQVDLSSYGEITTDWKTYTIPVADMGISNSKGFVIHEVSGQTQEASYIDSVEYISPTSISAAVSGSDVNASDNATPISSYPIYVNSLGQGWVDWSWGGSVSMGSSISFNSSAWGGLYLHSDSGVDTVQYSHITFSAKGSQDNQKFKILIYDQNNNFISQVDLSDYGELSSGSFKTYNISLSNLNAENRIIKGIVFQEALGQDQPTVLIKDIKLTGKSVESSVKSSTATSILTPTTVPNNSGGFTVSNGSMYRNGTKIILKGINWFGFETETLAPHGLWARNWKEMISQMKSLGFNAVRLPFCPNTLKGSPVSSVNYSKNQDLIGLNSLDILDKVVGEFNNQGMYILLDHHRPDCQAISELWHTDSLSEEQWINDLTFVAQRYKGLENFLGIDLKNEPHGSATWGTGNSSTDWNTAAEKAGKQVLSANPNILVFVEGIGESSTCSSNIGHFWGENFEPYKCNPISKDSIPSDKLVLSPHIYGPDVSHQEYFNAGNFPNNMPAIWDTHFGYLTDQGMTIVPGEWGGKYGNNGGSNKDVVLQNALVSYFKNKHICSSFYWDWNPNSGDTGGILQDDWNTVWQNKMDLLSGYYNSCN